MLLAIACRILSEFSVACLKRVLFSEGERGIGIDAFRLARKPLARVARPRQVEVH